MIRHAAILICLVALALCPSPLLAQTDTFPEAIGEYYRGYNFVASFSTSQERVAIAGGEISAQNLTSRQKVVAEKLADLAEMEASTDPDILQTEGIPVFVAPTIFRPDSVVWRSSDVLLVRVTAFDLYHSTNLDLVAAYESGWVEQLPDLTKWANVSSELHEWRFRGGRWLRNPSSLRELLN